MRLGASSVRRVGAGQVGGGSGSVLQRPESHFLRSHFLNAVVPRVLKQMGAFLFLDSPAPSHTQPRNMDFITATHGQIQTLATTFPASWDICFQSLRSGFYFLLQVFNKCPQNQRHGKGVQMFVAMKQKTRVSQSTLLHKKVRSEALFSVRYLRRAAFHFPFTF